MRVSTESISNEPLITNNCPVCQNSSNVPEHTLEHCPVIMQSELRLPDITSPPTPSFRLVTGHPPPSQPTTPMRSHEDSNEQGSLLEWIQRQVVTVEQTMNDGMEELADSVSQVTGTSFGTPFSSTPMNTGWKSGLMRSYQHKLHALPFDQHVELCDKIDELANNLKTTGNAVTYAMFLINLRIKYNENAEDERLVRNLLSNIENDSVVKELETVQEDDLVTLPPTSTKLLSTSTKLPPTSTKSQTRPQFIVEGIPLSKSSPVMIETVLSVDDVLESTILQDKLAAQHKEQVKIIQAVLDQFMNLSKGSKIADKGQDMMTKLVLAQTADNFEPIPKVASDTAVGEWMDSSHSILPALLWDIDGTSMINMKGVVSVDASNHYWEQSTKLGIIMQHLLKNKKLTDCIKSLKATIKTNDGVLLMDSIHKNLLSLATTRILEVLTEIGLCMQKNGELVDHFGSREENLFLQVDKLRYKSVKDLKLAFCQREILQGAYHKHSSLAWFAEKLQNAETDLKS